MVKGAATTVALLTGAIVVGVLTSGLFATGRGDARATRAATLPLPRVMECFLVDAGADPNVAVQLRTRNFGTDYVRVRGLAFMCEGARKTRGRLVIGEPGGHVFACYRIERGDDPDDPVVLDTTNFPADRVDVRRAGLMCESARKVRGTLVVGHAGEHVLECFGLALGANPSAAALLTTQNFGNDSVVVTTSVRMCEEATKTRGGVTIGAASGRVWQCYSLTGGLDPTAAATLTTQNFGADAVEVRVATQMCERAAKTPIAASATEPDAQTGQAPAD
jgi:hypothetical protein